MTTPGEERTGEQKIPYKSHTDRNPDAAKIIPDSKFQEEDDVKATVNVGGKRVSKKFTVAKAHWDGAQWTYQLRKADGELQDGGHWFLQRQLSFV